MRLTTMLAVCAAAVVIATEPCAAAGSYDGTYEGTLLEVKGTISGGRINPCNTEFTKPGRLTIVNSHAHARWGTGMLEGDVSPDGKVIMHSPAAGRFEGQIDTSGALNGYYQSYCIVKLAWQRRK